MHVEEIWYGIHWPAWQVYGLPLDLHKRKLVHVRSSRALIQHASPYQTVNKVKLFSFSHTYQRSSYLHLVGQVFALFFGVFEMLSVSIGFGIRTLSRH